METDPGDPQKAMHLIQGEGVDQIDPRVQIELEKLNLASEEINKLENEIDEARTKYRMTFAESSGKMTVIAKKSRKSIQKSREYYELKEQAKMIKEILSTITTALTIEYQKEHCRTHRCMKFRIRPLDLAQLDLVLRSCGQGQAEQGQGDVYETSYASGQTSSKLEAQAESLKAARQYQSAISIYRAAKETVTVAEDRLSQKGEVQLSSAWQEMMNHATMRLMEAETEKRRSQEQHMVMTSRCAELEHQLKILERKYKRSIAKARPYFETKQQLEIKLQQLKQNVSDLQAAIKTAKTRYSGTLKTLESISEEIHESRREKLLLMFPRQPGVGAESDSVASSLCDLSLDIAVESINTDGSCDTADENEAVESVSGFSRMDHYSVQDNNQSGSALHREDTNQIRGQEHLESTTDITSTDNASKVCQRLLDEDENEYETSKLNDCLQKGIEEDPGLKVETTSTENTVLDFHERDSNLSVNHIHLNESDNLLCNVSDHTHMSNEDSNSSNSQVHTITNDHGLTEKGEDNILTDKT